LDTIRIFETSDEYLLEIPAREKERARKIEGRNWDPKRRCWVYPKMEEIRKELVSEFKDDLSEENLNLLSITTFSPSPHKDKPEQVESRLYEKPNLTGSPTVPREKSSTSTTVRLSNEKFNELENSILELELRLLEKDKSINELKEVNASLLEEIQKLHKKYEKLDELEQQIIEKDNNIKELSEENTSLISETLRHNLALKELRELKLESLEKDKKIKKSAEVIGQLQIDLRKIEQELMVLQDIRIQSLEKDKNIKNLLGLNATLRTEVKKLREAPAQMKKIPAAREESEQVTAELKNIPLKQMKRLAINLAIESGEFESFINSHSDIDLRFISNFNTFMEKRFKELLNISSYEKATLFQLIEKSKDGEYITTGEAGLAHFLRIERNRMVHDYTFTAPSKKDLYRYVIIAALLWQDIKG
jgi:DNA repair exonuclease SbcCD ATPase subunit